MESDLKPGRRLVKSSKTTASKAKTETETFRTPDEVAADQVMETTPEATPIAIDRQPNGPKSSWKEKLTLHWPPGKKEVIVALVLVVLIIGGGAGYALTHKTKPKPATLKAIPKVTPKSKTVPSTLSGLPVDP